MTTKKNLYTKKVLFSKYIFALLLLISGILLNFFNLGTNQFFSFQSVGNYLIYTSFLLIFIITLSYNRHKDRIIDERHQMIGSLSYKATFITLIIASFIIMIYDGIHKITIAYSQFMSFLICSLLIVYFIAFKYYDKKYS